VSSLVEALYCNAGRDQRSQHGQWSKRESHLI
jgi:hypothetical protein